MIVAVRRALAGLFLGLVFSFGVAGLAAAATPTASPTASASPTATAPTDATDTADTADVTPDNSRQIIAIGAAGVVAIVAATLVFLRRR